MQCFAAPCPASLDPAFPISVFLLRAVHREVRQASSLRCPLDVRQGGSRRRLCACSAAPYSSDEYGYIPYNSNARCSHGRTAKYRDWLSETVSGSNIEQASILPSTHLTDRLFLLGTTDPA
jgi:hypothetical protein